MAQIPPASHSMLLEDQGTQTAILMAVLKSPFTKPLPLRELAPARYEQSLTTGQVLVSSIKQVIYELKFR